MRLRLTASSSQPGALAVARLLQVTPREALALMAETRVLPFELDASAAESACASLRKHGLEVEPVTVPPTSSRCQAHPSLTGDVACEDCRTLSCPLCAPLCRACVRRRASAARWKRVRVAVLLVLLAGLAGFGVLRQRRLERRTQWTRPVRVSVTLASPEPIEPAVLSAWSAGLESLDDWFAEEAERRGLRLERPVHFELAPATVEAEVPSPPGQATGEWLRDSQDAIELRGRLQAIADRGQATGVFDVQLVVALRTNAGHRVEGLGEAGGTIGLVDGNAGDTQLTLELVAVAHELLHCLGAADGYDEQGHALPRGIVEPERFFPQRYAEVMVGEVPLSATQGRVPRSLDEVRIGETTAKEIGW